VVASLLTANSPPLLPAYNNLCACRRPTGVQGDSRYRKQGGGGKGRVDRGELAGAGVGGCACAALGCTAHCLPPFDGLLSCWSVTRSS
jgi:hypothetical protein